MNFPYIKAKIWDKKHIKRESIVPWIRVGLFNPNAPTQIIYVFGLVDSGSDVTFLTHEIGEQIGFDIKNTKFKGSADGVGGGSVPLFFHKVGLVLEDSKDKFQFIDWVGFSYADFPISMPQQTAIFGTIGFFNHLNVSFKYPIGISINQSA